MFQALQLPEQALHERDLAQPIRTLAHTAPGTEAAIEIPRHLSKQWTSVTDDPIVGVDIAFFRDHPWERLAVNVGIVLVFGAFYFRFFRAT